MPTAVRTTLEGLGVLAVAGIILGVPYLFGDFGMVATAGLVTVAAIVAWRVTR